jgi:hypothetical protein
MLRRHLCAVIWFLAWSGTGSSKPQPTLPAQAIPVSAVDYNDRALNILKLLAQKYKVVIGVSGTLTDNDDLLIQVSKDNGTLKDLLDQVAKKDPRFEWHQLGDGSIDVRLRSNPVSLVDVIIKSFHINNPQRNDFPHFLLQIPEVKAWQSEHGCLIHELIIGKPPGNWRPFSVHLREQKFGMAMNQIADKSGAYFWSAIEYSNKPCAINIAP